MADNLTQPIVAQNMIDALFASNPQPMWIYDEETLDVLEVNNAACQQYGYSRTEFLELKIIQITSEDRIEDFLKHIQDNVDPQRHSHSRHRKKNNKNFPVELVAIQLTFNGIPARLVQVTDISHHVLIEEQLREARNEMQKGIEERTLEIHNTNNSLVREIEHRKEIEKMLVEREEFFRLISENMTDMIAVIDRDGNRLYNSTSYTSVIGDPEILHGTNSFDEIHPDDRERVQAIFRQTVETGIGQRTEYRFQLSNGKIRHVESLGSVILDERQNVSKVVVVSRDITDRRQTEQEVAQLATAIRAVGEAIMIIDTHDMIQFVNPAFESLTGYSAIEVIGRSPRILDSGEHDDDFFDAIFDKLRSGQSWSGTIKDRRKDGTNYIASETIAPIRSANGKIIGFVTVKRDITNQIQTEEEIRALNEDLEKRVSQRTSELEAANKELEAFSYSVSHDLRAPLRAVAGFTRILEDEHASRLNDDVRRYLGLVRKNSFQMGDLIDDLLEFSRLSRQQISKQPVDIEVLAQTVWDSLRPSWLDKEIEFMIHELPRGMADPALLKQVLVNLLSNAIKFSATRSPAIIEVGFEPERDTGQSRYFVRDNGVGFDKRYATNLFGVFQRLHHAEDYEGTGVGLAIVQRIIHRHGGLVSAESKPNEGATFSFTLESPGS